MARRALIYAAIAAVGFATAGRAADVTAQTTIITSDATAQFLPIEVGKFVVIDLPANAKSVLVADKRIANVLMQTARRATILATSSGQTNLAFYDAEQRQIQAFDVSVQKYPVPSAVPRGPESVMIVFRGSSAESLSCTHSSNLSDGAGCYALEGSSPTLDSLPKGSSITMPAGGGS
jgi:hypothetical protein